MQQSEQLWNRIDRQVVVVSFEPADVLPRLAEPFPKEWAFVSNTSRDLYDAYGLRKASLLALLSPRTVLAYTRALFSGRLTSRGPRGDGERPEVTQLGGDYVIDRAGTVRLAWESTTPADRPSIECYEEALGNIG
ncbi:MAG: hypothetical protein KDA27_11925 [Candidatus Eisenbacteria bacterium]|uniref:Redoxin domain-containing protein n=1 Tax=Eiseniibacteriota bacterium TaxID=2212470 RepID=A0A956SDC3_UNCEI|nr:hypothetical protein [Candidatus Eisenbacteria bacterium]